MIAAAKLEGDSQSPSQFTRRIVSLLKRERLVASELVPLVPEGVTTEPRCAGLSHLLADTKTHLDGLGPDGLTNPFDSIYLLVFRP